MGGKKREKQREIQLRRQIRKQDRQQKKNFQKKRKGGKIDAFKLSKQYIAFFEKFNNEIAVLKLKLKDVGGDGSCLFRAFSDQVNGNQYAHMDIRQEACRYIIENDDFFRPFIDED